MQIISNHTAYSPNFKRIEFTEKGKKLFDKLKAESAIEVSEFIKANPSYYDVSRVTDIYEEQKREKDNPIPVIIDVFEFNKDSKKGAGVEKRLGVKIAELPPVKISGGVHFSEDDLFGRICYDEPSNEISGASYISQILNLLPEELYKEYTKLINSLNNTGSLSTQDYIQEMGKCIPDDYHKKWFDGLRKSSPLHNKKKKSSK